MKHIYISLGSACDTAMILDEFCIRKKSYPFDWLWNLDYGLEAINRMLTEDFFTVLTPNAYSNAEHYRFDKKQIVYERYPSIVHMHSDPLKDISAHEQLVRRIRRFEKRLHENCFIHFLYYKNYNEEKLKHSNISINDTVDTMLKDANNFTDLISKKYACNNFHLLLILQTDLQDMNDALNITRDYKRQMKQKISIGYTISRTDDENVNKIWRKQWRHQLFFNTQMPLCYMLKIFTQYSVHKVIIKWNKLKLLLSSKNRSY